MIDEDFMHDKRPFGGHTQYRKEVLPAGVPRRFSIGTMLGLTAVFAVLLGVLRMLGFGPIGMVIVAGWLLLIAVAQAVLFKGQRPRLASSVAGMGSVAVLYAFAVGSSIYHGVPPGLFIPQLLVGCFCVLPFAALFGYLTGIVLAGVILVSTRVRSGHWNQTRQVEVPLRTWEFWRTIRETEHLGLRPFEHADAGAVLRLVGDPEVTSQAIMSVYPTLTWAQTWIGTHEHYAHYGNSVTLAILRRDDSQLVGAVRLRFHFSSRQPELDGWIGRAYWNQGYATEAAEALLRVGFEQMQWEGVFAEPTVGNRAAARVLEKLGLQPTRLLGSYRKKNGVREDCQRYTISAEAWNARHTQERKIHTPALPEGEA